MTLSPDPIVAEIRKSRELPAARFAYNIRAIVKDAADRDATDSGEIVRLPARRSVPVPHATTMAKKMTLCFNSFNSSAQ